MLLFLLRVSHSCALKMSTKYNKIFVITKILQNPTKYKFFLGEKVLILRKRLPVLNIFSNFPYNIIYEKFGCGVKCCTMLSRSVMSNSLQLHGL